jgi:hypothetical protein
VDVVIRVKCNFLVLLGRRLLFVYLEVDVTRVKCINLVKLAVVYFLFIVLSK